MKTSLVNARILRITDIESERLDPIAVALLSVEKRKLLSIQPRRNDHGRN